MATQWTAGLTDNTALPASTLNTIGAAWETWTPTVTQPGTITSTITYAKYARIQKIVVAQCFVVITGTGTAATPIKVSLPITALSNAATVTGSAIFYDASANNIYVLSVLPDTTTAVSFYYNLTGASSVFGTTPNIQLAANDQIRLTCVYEAA